MCILRCTPICAQGTGANDTVSHHPLTHEVGFDFRPVYIIPTNEFFAGENATWQPLRKSVSAHLKYSFRFHPESHNGKLYPHTYQGIGISYHSFFDKAEIGTPVSVYAFQGSRIARLSSRLSLDYEWNFGASFGWEKYHPGTNTYNYVVGSKINAYINLGFLLNWQLATGWRLTAGIDLSHFSNGNTQYPNAGVNTVGGKIGLVRTFGENAGTMMSDRLTTQRIKPHISYDIVYTVPRNGKGLSSQMKPTWPPVRSVYWDLISIPCITSTNISVPEHRSTYNMTKVPTSRNTRPTITTRPNISFTVRHSKNN